MDVTEAARRRLRDRDRRIPHDAPPLSGREEAYAVQSEVARLRVRRGETLIGYKVGCTSAATQRQLGIDRPVFGPLFDSERWSSGTTLRREQFLELAIEGELAVRLRSDLGNEPSEADVSDAVDAVFAVIELHHFPFVDTGTSAVELIASNGLHAGFVFADDGASALDAGSSTLSIEIDGLEVAAVAGTELTRTIQTSLHWLAWELASRGERLRAAQTILCGTVAPLLPAPEANRILVTTDRFGSVRCVVVDGDGPS